MLIEIRSYHFDPKRIDAYRQWAQSKAVPHLRSQFDVVGFWVDNGMEPEYGGRSSEAGPLGAATVTWIIRWPDRARRDAAWKQLRASPEWKAILATVPGGWRSYLRTEARFATQIEE